MSTCVQNGFVMDMALEGVLELRGTMSASCSCRSNCHSSTSGGGKRREKRETVVWLCSRSEKAVYLRACMCVCECVCCSCVLCVAGPMVVSPVLVRAGTIQFAAIVPLIISYPPLKHTHSYKKDHCKSHNQLDFCFGIKLSNGCATYPIIFKLGLVGPSHILCVPCMCVWDSSFLCIPFDRLNRTDTATFNGIAG